MYIYIHIYMSRRVWQIRGHFFTVLFYMTAKRQSNRVPCFDSPKR